MLNYNSASELKTFLESEGLGIQKKFGQNFLINPETRKKLVNALITDNTQLINSGEEVWEIGPGLGAMTALLLEKGFNVTAFEIDTGFIRVLKKMFQVNGKFNLIEGDVMKTWSSQKPARFLLGNLPYNIAASLLADFTEKGRVFSRIVVTVQKEVALRMVAKAGSADYSSFSVLCASVYKVKPLMTIRPSSFYPKPNVDSMGVLLEAKSEAETLPKIFFPLVRALFSSRRKTIKNNLLKFSVPFFRSLATAKDTYLCEKVFSDNNLTGNERAETLELPQFISLARSLEQSLE